MLVFMLVLFCDFVLVVDLRLVCFGLCLFWCFCLLWVILFVGLWLVVGMFVGLVLGGGFR